ncbi:single-stranded DNA-binding protein [Dyadobacter fermentans]|uniref:Single-stranded DNA-binding protein n=1 Tax=Dyadobacter fermentans (strain ATCC 700827 / DSM 18053 / CIP 107007 / KCTC 52180 / NS114) TaxID=471854 RepID=C6VVF4_DYAFD|nr:single-stranded DNA-binding protein [Dyadobacter fermentans]ACT96684.1 single-strand binding protein [Dyadobacter fermentans DSM 18053]
MKQIQIIGNLGRDAKIFSSNGSEFISFSVAVNDDYTNANGERIERTDWFNVTTTRLSLLQYLTKGTKVFVQGPIRSKPFTKEDGSTVVDINVSATWVQLLGTPGTAEAAPAQQSRVNPDPEGINQDLMAEMAAQNESDDLPF